MKPLFDDPSLYDRISNVQAAWGRAVVDDVVRLVGNARVEVAADIGCGSGRVTEMLVEALRPSTVVLQDISEGMLETAQARLAGRVSTRTVPGDAAQFVSPVPCDLVFSNAVFHWIRDHDAFAASIHRALSRRGWVRMQGGGLGNLRRANGLARRVFEELTGRAPSAYPAHFSSPDEWVPRLTALGFVDVECRLRDAATPFATREEFRAFTSSVTLLPLLRELVDDGERRRFVDAYAMAAEGELGLSLDYVRLDITARRTA